LKQRNIPRSFISLFIFGRFAAKSKEALHILKRRVSQDNDWRVQEILAKAFDRYCSDVSYEKALPVIKGWLADFSGNVRRAVTEGLRIWTGRPYFHDHPEVAVLLLSQLRNDKSEYVRKSVENALRDISKKRPDLVKSELIISRQAPAESFWPVRFSPTASQRTL
jgi:HEAT repeat protein